jgi:hypothetical protein
VNLLAFELDLTIESVADHWMMEYPSRSLAGTRNQPMLRYHLTPILTLFFAMATPSARAASYTIDFITTSGLAPTSGTFDYDPTNGFSNFIVVWDGIQFDSSNPDIFFNLSESANAPEGSGCGTYNAALSFSFFEGNTPCAFLGETSATDYWGAGSDGLTVPGIVFSDGIDHSLGISANGITPTNPNFESGGGSFTVALDAPEPKTAVLAVAGGVILMLKKRRA